MSVRDTVYFVVNSVRTGRSHIKEMGHRVARQPTKT
jgi:hypothetical protein